MRDIEHSLHELYVGRFGPLPEAAPCFLVSAPGRVELAGNHTDHQGGHTLSAAIDHRAWALAVPDDSDVIRAYMDGFGEATIRLTDLEVHTDEQGTSAALIRGMAAAYAGSGKPLRGFSMVTGSDIPVGAGVSSSAAFEVLVGTVLRALCAPDGDVDKPSELVDLALEGARTEQRYFGKPCGAQDQLASAFGGIVSLDFSDDTPQVTPIAFDFEASGYSLCLIDSRCDHSLFPDDFAAIPEDMFTAARYFNQNRLGDLSFDDFLAQLGGLRAKLGDRVALRALHFFGEDRRVQAQTQALGAGDLRGFLNLARLSGASSAQYLQNLSTHTDTKRTEQPATLILALCSHLLDETPPGQGACRLAAPPGQPHSAYRIHGGGFGGSVLAFIPIEQTERFMTSLDTLLGYKACTVLKISTRGAFFTRLTR